MFSSFPGTLVFKLNLTFLVLLSPRYLGEKQDWDEFLAHSCVTFIDFDSIHMVMMENLAAAKSL